MLTCDKSPFLALGFSLSAVLVISSCGHERSNSDSPLPRVPNANAAINGSLPGDTVAKAKPSDSHAQIGTSYSSPNLVFTASVIKVSGPHDCEARIRIEVENMPFPLEKHYDWPNHQQGLCINKMQWTPDSKYLVIGLENSGGDRSWHYPVEVFSVEKWLMFDFENGLSAAITAAGFNVLAPHTIEVETTVHTAIGELEPKHQRVNLDDFVRGQTVQSTAKASPADPPVDATIHRGIHLLPEAVNCVIVMQYSPDTSKKQQDNGIPTNSDLMQSAEAHAEMLGRYHTELREVNQSTNLSYVLHALNAFHARCCMTIAVVSRAGADGSIEVPYDLPNQDELTAGSKTAYGRLLGGAAAKSSWGRDRLDELVNGVRETVCKDREAEAVKSFQVLYGNSETHP